MILLLLSTIILSSTFSEAVAEFERVLNTFMKGTSFTDSFKDTQYAEMLEFNKSNMSDREYCEDFEKNNKDICEELNRINGCDFKSCYDSNETIIADCWNSQFNEVNDAAQVVECNKKPKKNIWSFLKKIFNK